jgi:hypothetical protein
MYKSFLKFSMLLFVLGGSTLNAATPEELDRQERELARKASQLQVLNLNYGKFKALYDGPFYGPSGLVSRMENLNKSTLDLVTRWDSLLQATAFAQQMNGVKQIDVINKIKTLLSDRRSDLENLREQGNQIRSQILRIQDSLNLIEVVSEGNFASSGYASYVSAYNKNLVDLKKTLDQADAYTLGRMNELANFTSRSEKTIIENLRQLLISRGVADVQSAVQQAQNVLRVDNIGGRRLARAKALFKKITVFDSYYLVYHAEKVLKSLEGEVSSARVELQSPANRGPIANDYLAALDQVYKEASERVALMQSSAPADNALFAQMLLPDYFKPFCESKNVQYNCSMLNTLTKLSETQLKSMTAEQLKDLEYLWDRVGPIAAAQ